MIALGRVYMLLPGLLLYALGWEVALALGQDFDAGRFLLGYLAFALPHLSMSYSDDYFDGEGDRLGRPAGFTGGSGVLLRSPQLAPAALRAAKALLIAGFMALVAFIILYPSSWLLPFVFVSGAMLGWYYSAPPVRLSARGMAEVSTMIGVGVIMPLAGCLCSGLVPLPGLVLFMVPLSLYALSFILSVELPDAEADRASGKSTYVSRNGVEAGSRLAALAMISGTLSLALICLDGTFIPKEMAVLTAASIVPAAVFLLLAIARPPADVRALAGVSGLVAFLIMALLAIPLLA
jgi:1,4-dihydroxy-2-naphthoate octaprenyltransferase